MPKLTKEQLETLALNLKFPYHFVKLMCDGYAISLAVKPKNKSGLSYCVMTYINDHFKGVWCKQDAPCPEQKFLNKRTRPLFRKVQIDKVEKSIGKKRTQKFLKEHQKTLVWFDPTWPSGKAALNHLNRVCESIEVVESI